MSMYRQGDVLFVKVDKVPKGAKTKKDNVIVEGEATGHAHRVKDGTLFTHKENNFWRTPEDLFVEAFKGTSIVHEEHGTIKLPEGVYRVVIQREYDGPGSVRQVLD